MKVTDVKTFIVYPGIGKNWLFVKVETDEGIVGWGEGYTQADRDQVVVEHIRQMSRYLVDRNPFNIKHFTHVMYMDYAGKRGAMDFYCAVSAIEQALWDIVGKSLNTPVYNLLGGACRDKIRVYANGWSDGAKTPDQLAANAVRTIERGFTALKFDPFPNPWREYIGRQDEQKAIDNVRAVREAVGPTVDVLVEVHRRLAPIHAVRVARAIEQYNPFWYEEPVCAENLDALAEARREINLPIVTGEALYTKAEFRDVFEKRAADIINPDICNCGGILELKEIAAMAEAYYVVVSPHNYNSTTIGLAATIQLAAAIPNFLITEYFVNFEEMGQKVADHPLLPTNGYIALPTGPGLGVNLREEELLQRVGQQFPKRNIRQFGEEGP